MDVLSKLFDYQKFEGNEKLAGMIEETESKYGTRLSIVDLDRVSAAGENMQSLKPADKIGMEINAEIYPEK